MHEILTAPWGISQVVVNFSEEGFIKWPDYQGQQLDEIYEKSTNKEDISKQQEPDGPALPVFHHQTYNINFMELQINCIAN